MSDKSPQVIRYRRGYQFFKRFLGLVLLVLKILERLKDLLS